MLGIFIPAIVVGVIVGAVVISVRGGQKARRDGSIGSIQTSGDSGDFQHHDNCYDSGGSD